MKACMRRKMWSSWILLIVASALFSGISVVFAMYLSWIIDYALPEKAGLFSKMIWAGVFVLAGSLCMYLFYLINEQVIKNKILRNLRKCLFGNIYAQSIVDFQKKNTAEYLSQLTNDMKIVEENYIEPLLNVAGGAVNIVISFAVILYFAPMVALVVLISVVVIMVVPAALSRILQKKQEVYSRQSAVFTNRTKDLLSGYEEVSSVGCKEDAKREYEEENRIYTQERLRAEGWTAASQCISQVLGMVVQTAVALTCVWYIMQGKMSVGVLMMLVQVMNLFIYPLTGVIEAIPQMRGTKPVLESMESYLGEKTDEKEWKFSKSITLSHLNFSYDGQTPILKDISLTLEKGKKYVIVGPSGCGKSTLLKLLSGYYNSYDGEILVDDKAADKQEIHGLLRLCAFIHQNVFLFDKTIKDNICMYQSCDDRRFGDVLMRSGAAKFIGSEILPEQAVGENGSKLSGGQKQRIAIARALFQDKPVILLDEGTSALDEQTAYEIEADLLKDASITLVTVTHHLNEKLRHKYDQIITIDEGKIVSMEMM